jgi:hypothetical protein
MSGGGTILMVFSAVVVLQQESTQSGPLNSFSEVSAAAVPGQPDAAGGNTALGLHVGAGSMDNPPLPIGRDS